MIQISSVRFSPRTLATTIGLARSNQSIPKGNQLIGSTEAEVEAPLLWPTDAKSQLFGKEPYAGKD